MMLLRNSRWTRIVVFYAIAIGFSALARVYWHTGEQFREGALSVYWHLIGGIGPFIGAVVAWLLFRSERRVTFLGAYPAMSLAMLATPAVVMGLMGIDNPFLVDPHLFGVHMGVWVAAYVLLEETGWRGYLQGEFADRTT